MPRGSTCTSTRLFKHLSHHHTCPSVPSLGPQHTREPVGLCRAGSALPPGVTPAEPAKHWASLTSLLLSVPVGPSGKPTVAPFRGTCSTATHTPASLTPSLDRVPPTAAAEGAFQPVGLSLSFLALPHIPKGRFQTFVPNSPPPHPSPRRDVKIESAGQLDACLCFICENEVSSSAKN